MNLKKKRSILVNKLTNYQRRNTIIGTIANEMKQKDRVIIRNLFILIFVFIITGCQKVISIDVLPLHEKKYVIEANLSDKDDSIRVIVSRTLSISNPSLFDPFDNAIVTLKKDNLIPVLLNGKGKGKYTGYMKTEVGADYLLEVEIDGSSFTATCKMPPKVLIDTLFVTPSTILGKPKNLATVKFSDPPEQDNYYQFLLSTNGFENSSIFITDDRLFNGRNVKYELNDFLVEKNERYSIDKHDWVYVEARNIDPSIYKYFYSLKEYTINPGPGNTPDNPVSNIVGGALGYFSVHSYQWLKCVSPY